MVKLETPGKGQPPHSIHSLEIQSCCSGILSHVNIYELRLVETTSMDAWALLENKKDKQIVE